MKKNNKYRSSNNYNSQIYSLNYKFDSISSAGKFSGTALDLIKRYNELAKEAQGNGDYVEAENFRQYAEHYRKIVTEINERKNQRVNYQNSSEEKMIEKTENKSDEISPSEESSINEENAQPVTGEKTESAAPKKRSFKVIEIKSVNKPEEEKTTKTRTRTPRKSKEEAVVAQ
ncbi:MAG: DUF4167 domain-containing protein [Alphaproteobacteria bacterium]|nr:DUF4167 domain-containing protein [Alphaproteobacteria bacterium]